MIEIDAKDFIKATELDPDWISRLTEDVAIKGYVDMNGNDKITTLSEKLHFLGDDSHELAASFEGCPNLKNAKGEFNRGVSFKGAGIKLLNITIKNPSKEDFWAVDVSGCLKLEKIESILKGSINASGSGVSNIEKLEVDQCSKIGIAADFSGCPNLKKADGKYAGPVDFEGSGVKKIMPSLTINIPKYKYTGYEANFLKCGDLTNIPLNCLNKNYLIEDLKLLREEAIKAGLIKEEGMKRSLGKDLETGNGGISFPPFPSIH